MKLIPSLLQELKLNKFPIFGVIFFLGLAKISTFGAPFLLKILIDGIAEKNTDVNFLVFTPIFLVIAYGLCVFLNLVFNEVKDFIAVKVTQNVIANASIKVFRAVQILSLDFHLKKQSGHIARLIDRGLRGIQSIFSISIHSIFPSLIELLAVLIYFYFSFPIYFSLIMLGSISSYIIFTILVTDKYLLPIKVDLNDADSVTYQKLIDSLLNIESIKLFGREDDELKAYSQLSRNYFDVHIKSQKIHSLLYVGQQFIVAIGLAAILWGAVDCVLNETMKIGDLVLISALIMQIFIPMSFLGVMHREIKQAILDIRLLEELIYIQNEFIQSNAPVIPIDKYDSLNISIKNISFSFGDGRKILDDISFDINAGDLVAVVGPSGSGKSTLIKLILKFYEPCGGEILFNDYPISNFDAKSVRSLVGVVPQDISLFNSSIKYNIAYSNLSSSIEDIISAAKLAQIDRAICKMPQGYETPVGERGLLLSGGEKQRVAIARALLKNPAFLIFDEASSSLDSETERNIFDEVIDISNGKTTLIVAHRLSSIINVKKIVVLSEGKVVGLGEHQKLLENCSIYADMWAAQSSENYC